ncbi:MAG TPA: hypothetical protein VEB40_05110 [Flavipsychrobacter sp.]|nr:hypothetical protein [Flavipsychrobacter sp.]
MGKRSAPSSAGNGYTLADRKKVWAKTMPIDGHPPDIWRRDTFGNVINWQEYGNPESKYGWEIVNNSPAGSSSQSLEHLKAIALLAKQS